MAFLTQDGNHLVISIPVPTTRTLGIMAMCGASAVALVHALRRPADPEDPADFLAWGQSLLRWLVKYRTKDARKLPVISRVKPNYLRSALSPMTEQGEGWQQLMTELDTCIVPGLTHWESNAFFAYFKPHSAYPAVLGELVCAGLNVMGFDWIASPACTELEIVTMDWLANVLRLPEVFLSTHPGHGGGVIQGSAGESALVVLLAACDATMRRLNTPCTREVMVVYSSDQTHAIVEKACKILGFQHHVVATVEASNWTLRAADLEHAVSTDLAKGLQPIAVVATLGTTTSCAFDHLPSLSPVCAKHQLWLHVDGAYGGAYACLPELDHHFLGLGDVDSFCVNCHKKLLCPFDLAALYLRDRRPVINALCTTPEYLRNEASDSGRVVDFEHWQLPLGRRFRSMKLWFVLKRFGAEGIRQHVRRGIELRDHVYGLLLKEDDLFELAAPLSLSLVCFRVKGKSDEDQHRLLRAVKATGRCFVIHSKLGGRPMIRFACGGIEQTFDDVEQGWNVIATEAHSLFRPNK